MSTGTRSSPASFLKHATDVASFYGFTPVKVLEKSFSKSSQALAHLSFEKPRGAHSLTSAAAITATYAALHPQEPALAFFATPYTSFTPHTIPQGESGEFTLMVMGTSESVGEIVLLKTVSMILEEWGAPVARIRVNALGDRDSQMRFARELSLHVRKHVGRIDPICTHQNTQDPLALYRCAVQTCRDIIAEGPRPVHFLSEKSRVHFRSVLENLERLGLPYEIDDSLAGDEKSPHITFAIDLKDEDATVFGAYGGRFDEFAKREAKRKDAAGAAASIYFKKKGTSKSHFSVMPAARKPKVYFAQLGLRAKLQGLFVVDMFRQAHVPLMQSFDSSRLGMQLQSAQAQGVSHLIIMGQREALDGTVIVRTMHNSSQVTIPVSEIPKILRGLR